METSGNRDLLAEARIARENTNERKSHSPRIHPSTSTRPGGFGRYSAGNHPCLGGCTGPAAVPWRSQRTADDHGFSAEGRDDSAALASTAARNAVRGVRQRRFHAERPVLCPLALGSH